MSKKSVVLLTMLGAAAAAAGAFAVRRYNADATTTPSGIDAVAPVAQRNTDDAEALDAKLASDFDEDFEALDKSVVTVDKDAATRS